MNGKDKMLTFFVKVFFIFAMNVVFTIIEYKTQQNDSTRTYLE